MDTSSAGPSPEGGRGLTDGELLSRWLDERNDDDGAMSVVVFIRYRELVRVELERAGLTPLNAVERVSTVFHLAQGNHPHIPPDTPLRERLLTIAREVGIDPNWSPP